MSLANQVMKASSLLVISKLAGNLLTTLNIFILARLLTPEDFGLVAIASVIVTTIQSMVQVPVAQALIRTQDPERSHFDTAWTINVLRTLVLAVVLCAIALPVADFYHEAEVTGIMIALAVAVLINGFTNPKFVLFEKKLNFSYLLLVNSISKSLAIIISIAYAYYTQSYWALIIGNIITQTSSVIFTYVFLPYLPRFSLAKAKEIFSFSVWLSLSIVVKNLSWRFDQLIAGKLFGSAILGVYNVGSELATLVTREVSTPLNRALFPAFANIGEDLARLRNAYTTSISVLYSISLPLGFGIVLVAPQLIYLALGAKWMGAVEVIQFVGGVAAMSCCTSVVKSIAMARGQTKLLFKRDMLFLGIRVTALSIGAWLFGLTGLLIGRVCSTLIILSLNFTLMRVLIDISIKEQIYAISRAFIATAAMVLLLCQLPFANTVDGSVMTLIAYLLAKVALGGFIYAACHIMFWLVQGKPDGIERKVLQLAQKKLGKLPFNLKV